MDGKISLPMRFTTISIILFVIWLLMVGTLQAQELITGLVISLVIAFIALPKLAIMDDIRLSFGLPFYFLQYLIVFLRALIISNIDMARRVVSPNLPISPDIVEIETHLRSPLGKLMLANSITLTPGTLTVDVVDNILRIHWIDTRSVDELHSATRIIAEQFEKPLLRFIR